MRTDGVILGNLKRCGDHVHLEWVCPDCGSSGFTGGEDNPYRICCAITGREFLVVGIASKTAGRSG